MPTRSPAARDRSSGWLLLVYRVPSEPTRLRATVWRRLKSLGAIYLQSAAAALPATAAGERALRKLRHEIIELGGSAVLLRCDALAGEEEVVAAFQAARDDEYEEIVDRARDFLVQVDKEHAADHFTFAELEENEVDLVKLQNWLAKVQARDTFGSPGRQAAVEALAACEASLEGYAGQVYARDADAH
ncbi:MAG TPA: Chromate resistance protein ChrB [Acidimicrobiales bacterium]|nr:Chromate resistance protein ChrB [Acidimicrobiales bacterium]